ncbi:MAG: hypothetical protein WA694_10685, partial [Pseudolabrys sp.]
GLNMLHEYAHYVEGTGQKSVSVEAGLMDMLQRMESGRFKVFKHLNDFWEEFRLYHRRDGKVVKEGDDLMCATRGRGDRDRKIRFMRRRPDRRLPLLEAMNIGFVSLG